MKQSYLHVETFTLKVTYNAVFREAKVHRVKPVKSFILLQVIGDDGLYGVFPVGTERSGQMPRGLCKNIPSLPGSPWGESVAPRPYIKQSMRGRGVEQGENII